MPRTDWIPFGLFAVCQLACAQLLDLPSDPELLPQDDRWSCLGATTAALSAPEQTTATVHVYACDFITDCSFPVTGVTARVCAKRDVGCTNPIVENMVDDEGVIDVPLPTGLEGFDGYLEVRAPVASCTDEEVFGSAGPMLCGLVPDCDVESPDNRCMVPTYARSLLFFNPPVRGDREAPMPLPMLSSAGLPAVVQAAGADLDPGAGNLFITALDCNGMPASGVTYSIQQHQDEVTQLYVDSGVVSDTVLETDDSGIGGFVGVPPGFAEVVGYNENLERIGEIGVQSAPFTMTYSALVPSP